MTTLVVRRATAEDIDAFSAMPNKPTCRAMAGEIDGRIVALGGLALIAGRWHAFCDLTPEVRNHKIAIARTAQRLIAEARRDGVRFIYAEADPNEPGAIAWMTRLGFHLDPRSQHFYRWSA